jgi:hypothetical protein
VEFLREADPLDAAAVADRPARRRWPTVLGAVLVAAVVLGAALVRHSSGGTGPRAAAASRALLDRGATPPHRIASGCSRTLQCGGKWGLPAPIVARVRVRFPAAEPVAYAVTRGTDGALQYRHLGFAVRGAALSIDVVAHAGRPRSHAAHPAVTGTSPVLRCDQGRFTVTVSWSGRPAPHAALAALVADTGLTAVG